MDEAAGQPRAIPDELLDLLTSNVIGVVSSVRADGSIASHLMWIDWDGRRLLTSSPIGSRKARNWRRNPQASVVAVDPSDHWRYVILRGRVVDISPDEDLRFIDRMSERYTGARYGMRSRPREVFEIEPDHFRTSTGRRWPSR